jgi:hypothetical protein
MYLCHWMRESGLAELLPSLGDTVYVGLSAGSLVLAPRIGEDFVAFRTPTGDDTTLGVVEFAIFPHVGSPDCPERAKARGDSSVGAGSGQPLFGSPGRGQAQPRMPRFPGGPHPARKVELRPDPHERRPIDIGAEFLDADGLAEDVLVHPGEHGRLFEVEGSLWPPPEAQRQLHEAARRPGQLAQGARHQDRPVGPGEVDGDTSSGGHAISVNRHPAQTEFLVS